MIEISKMRLNVIVIIKIMIRIIRFEAGRFINSDK